MQDFPLNASTAEFTAMLRRLKAIQVCFHPRFRRSRSSPLVVQVSRAGHSVASGMNGGGVEDDVKGVQWTDRQTKAVLFDWTIYNIELNTFLSHRLAFEFQPHGFVVVYPSVRAFKVGYVRGNDVVLLALDITVGHKSQEHCVSLSR